MEEKTPAPKKRVVRKKPTIVRSAKFEKRFSFRTRADSLVHAIRGIQIFIRGEHNAWIHLFGLGAVICLGIQYHISSVEWALITIAVGMVFVTEAVNTAIECDMDLTSPEFHPYARDTKDIAAGAALIAAGVALIIGLIIFLPKIF